VSRKAYGLWVELFGEAVCSLDGARVHLPSGKPTALLALLALECGRTVRITEVVDALWPDDPPQSARALVHTYVSSLRRSLVGDSALETMPGGYRLGLERDHVDVHRVIGAASRDIPADWAAALALSREPILAGRDLPFVNRWQRRVDDVREGLQQRCWAYRVGQGEATAVLPEIQEAVRTEPLREDTVQLLARALGAAGRHDEGIAALDGLRLRMARELGLGPSPSHHELRARLVSRGRGVLVAPAPPRRPQQQPTDAAHSVESLVQPRPHVRRRGLLVVAAVAAVAVLSTGLWWFQRTTANLPTQVTGFALVEVGPPGDIIRVIELPLDPDEVHADPTTAWVMSSGARALASIDLGAGEDTNVIGLPDAPVSLALHEGKPIVSLGFSGLTVSVVEGALTAPVQPVANWNGKLLLSAAQTNPWYATTTGEVHPPPGIDGWSGPVQLPTQPVQIVTDGPLAWILTSGSLIASTGIR
jgi:DNA-binding SARP family transcriptional activator